MRRVDVDYFGAITPCEDQETSALGSCLEACLAEWHWAWLWERLLVQLGSPLRRDL